MCENGKEIFCRNIYSKVDNGNNGPFQWLCTLLCIFLHSCHHLCDHLRISMEQEDIVDDIQEAGNDAAKKVHHLRVE